MNPNRPTLSREEAKAFSKDFKELNVILMSRLKVAKTVTEAQEPLRMLEGMARFDFSPAKTMYGLAMLMIDKPWFDLVKGERWLKLGAEEAEKSENDGFSMYQYGMILLDGLHGVPRNPITGKYWIDKAAGMGFELAINEQNKRWK